MFDNIFKLAKSIVVAPVAAAVDVVNIVTLGAIDDTSESSYTERNLKNMGESAKDILDDLVDD